MATGGLYGNSGTGALIAQPGAETPGLYGKSPNGSVVAQPGSESAGLYGNGTTFGGYYFEWFVFQTSATQPATPTGGSWNFQTDSGTAPSGWTNAPASNPTNPVWISIALVNSRSTSPLVWSTPGVLSYSGTINGSGAPTSGIGQIGELYIQTGVTPNALWFKSGSTTWTQITGSALYVDLTSSQTIAGTKTFSSTIQGNISGNAGTVTNGVYTNGTYVDPSWIASLAGSKITGNISGNAANVTGTVAIVNGGTGATTASGARTNLGLGTIATQDASSVAITGGSITGITDLAIADGGTGASTAGQARTNLGLGTAAVLDAGVANGVATLDAGGTVPLSQIPASIQGGVSYQGAWNASTNTPTLASSVGTKGYYYVVSVAGSTNLNGVTSWNIGDWAIFNGTAWEKIDNTDAVTSVNGYTGTVVLTQPDISGTVPTSRTITAGTGLTGGGDLSADRTLAIDSTVVTLAGTQTLTNKTLTSPKINEILDTNGNEILGLSPTTSATDYLTVKNGIGVGVPLHLYADGPSTNIGFHIQPKGSGLVTISDGTDFNKGIRFRSSGSAASAVTLLDAVSTAGRVVTLPDATTTLVGRDTTDTLTNKTLTSPIVNTPDITGGTINNTVIGGTTPAAGTFTTLVSTGNITYFGGAIGSDVFRIYKNNTITGGTSTEASPAFSFIPKQSNFGASLVGLGENPRVNTIGTDGFYFTTSASTGFAGLTQLKVGHTASAVNYVQVTGNATGSGPIVSAQGSDASVDLLFSAKGTAGSHVFRTNTTTRQFQINHVTSAVNYATITGSATGSGVVFSAAGTDTNIDLNLTTKGTGSTKFNSGNGEQLRVTDGGAASTGFLNITGSTSGSNGVYLTSSANAMYLSATNGNNFRFFSNGAGVAEQLRISHTASAVNYVQVTGAATGGAVAVTAQGSDASIQLTLQSKGAGTVNLIDGSNSTGVRVQRSTAGGDTFLDVQRNVGLVELKAASGVTNGAFLVQSKGTGAIDLAAGSSGVNISNGGTVTAITRTNGGSTYTSFPTLTISAPTTAGGVQATASFTMGLGGVPVITSGGTGYTVGDVLTLVGGTFSSAATLTVSTVSTGVVTGVTVSNFGTYTVLPTNPISVTGGTGSGATFSPTWGVNTTFTITNAGSGYVEQPTVTFSGGGGSGAAAYARVGGDTSVKGLGTNLDFYTPNSSSVPAFRISDIASADSYYRSYAPAGGVNLIAQGATNANAAFGSNGTGTIFFTTNGTSLTTQMRVAHTASAVNYVQVTGAATGGIPRISTQGSDSAASLAVTAKSGTIWLETASGFGMVGVNHTAGANNYLALTGGANKGPVISAASGFNANVDLVLSPKGTGALQAQQTDSTATGGNARGANAVDWQTQRSAASRVASGAYAVVSGGISNSATGFASVTVCGDSNQSTTTYSFIGGGASNTSSGYGASIVGGYTNTVAGYFNFVGGGSTNSGTSGSAVTTQSATMNGTTAVTLSGSNANIKVGQLIVGTSINNFPNTYVAAISGTSLTLSQAASGSSTSTLSFYTPHGVVVGGGNNQATGSYSFIGGGGDAGTAANRNVASGDWGTIGGGRKNVASGAGSTVAGGGTDGANSFSNTASGTTSFIGGGWNNTAGGTLSVVVGGTSNSSSGVDSFIGGGDNHIASGLTSAIIGGRQGTTRGLSGYHAFPACYNPIANLSGVSQSGLLVLGRQTTDATATVITSDNNAASTTNQVILPNNSAYYFKVEIIANVTGGGNTSGWELKGVIKRGANAASTAIVGSVTSTLIAQDAGASTWVVSATADTTNGGLKITVTGQASTTIRWVAKASTTEVTF